MTSLNAAPTNFRTQYTLPLVEQDEEINVDLFAGGGGASTGLEMGLGRPVHIAVNHNPAAISMHEANHPGALHLQADIWEVDPVQVLAGQGETFMLSAMPIWVRPVAVGLSMAHQLERIA